MTLAELGQRVKKKYPGSYDSVADDDLARKMIAKYPVYRDQVSDWRMAVPRLTGFSAFTEPGSQAAQAGANIAAAIDQPGKGGIIPSALKLAEPIGGALGGIGAAAAAAPLAAGMAAIPGGQIPAVAGETAAAAGGAYAGGSAGKGLEQIALQAMGLPGAPQTGEQAVSEQGAAGRTQGVAEAIGRPVAAGVQALAGPVMGAALKTAKNSVIGKALGEGISATSAGMKAVMEKIGLAGKTTNALYKQASENGWRVNGVDLLGKLKEPGGTIEQISRGALPDEPLTRIGKLSDEFAKSHPGLLDATQVKDIVRDADANSEPLRKLYDAKKPLAPLSSSQVAELRWWQNLADQGRDFLQGARDLSGNRVGGIPGAAEAEAHTSALIGVKNQIAKKGGGGQGLPMLARVGIPAGVGGAAAAIGGGSPTQRLQRGLAFGALSSPEVMSHLALMLNSPALRNILQQAPRAGAMTLPGSQ